MIINLTPHDVNIFLPERIYGPDQVLVFPPSGHVAKVAEESVPVGDIEGVPACTKAYGAPGLLSREEFLAKVPNPHVEPMPEPREGVWLIVPMLVGQVLAGTRSDLIGPDYGIGGAARSADGKITGASGFIRY